MLVPATYVTVCSTPPADPALAAARRCVERQGAALLNTLELAVGSHGMALAYRLIDLFRTPGVQPARRDVSAALVAIQAGLEAVPYGVEPQYSAEGENRVPELDAAVAWWLARVTDLAARLS